VTLSVVARLFYYAVVCAALIALRRKRTASVGFRLPAGYLLAVLGIAIAVVLGVAAQISKQVDWGKSAILGATVAAALMNWVWARPRRAG
jgi:amino acid transporter